MRSLQYSAVKFDNIESLEVRFSFWLESIVFLLFRHEVSANFAVHQARIEDAFDYAGHEIGAIRPEVVLSLGGGSLLVVLAAADEGVRDWHRVYDAVLIDVVVRLLNAICRPVEQYLPDVVVNEVKHIDNFRFASAVFAYFVIVWYSFVPVNCKLKQFFSDWNSQVMQLVFYIQLVVLHELLSYFAKQVCKCRKTDFRPLDQLFI